LHACKGDAIRSAGSRVVTLGAKHPVPGSGEQGAEEGQLAIISLI